VSETTEKGTVVLHVDGKNYPLSISDDSLCSRMQNIESRFNRYEDQTRCDIAFYNHDLKNCIKSIKKLQWLCGGLLAWTVLQLIMSVV